MEEIKNPQKTALVICSLLIILGILFCFFPEILSIDGMDGGYAIVILSIFLLILPGLIAFPIYYKRYRLLNEFFFGKGVLARWQYDNVFWQKFLEIDYKEKLEINKGLMKLISYISLGIALFLVILIQDILIVYIMLGIVVFVSIPARLIPIIRKHRMSKNSGLIIIGETGVYLNGPFYNWGMAGSKFESAFIENIEGMDMLVIIYSFPSQQGTQNDIIRIPIPIGKMSEAQYLKEKYNQQKDFRF